MTDAPAPHDAGVALDALGQALARADELDEALTAAVAADQYRPYDDSARTCASVSAACVALEHGRALRVLVAQGLPTAALSLLRLQHEALTRAVWLLYAATDLAVDKLAAPLSKETEAAANKLPMLADMLKQLADKPAAAQPLLGLQAFKDNNAAALNSFVHGGIHALHRHTRGFPEPLVIGALRNCNGLLLMAGMMLAVLAGNQPMARRVSRLQVEFAADLPPPLPTHARAMAPWVKPKNTEVLEERTMSIEKIEPGMPESQSADILADNLVQLKALFPELVTEGANGPAINIDVLKALVGDETVTDADEKYGLNWHGKRAARQLALTPSAGTLRPCPEKSVDWETTQNLMIEGDNLEVLKLLQKSYGGKVKLIYIDPPYNTGKDFVYPDNFKDSIQNYLELTGQVEGGRKISSNTDTSGRFHTDWLNMLYPRLKLAHSLLKDDGVIFVSIADHEVHNLRAALNEVFGEENFIASVIWQKVYAPKNSARHFSEDHDYLVVFAKNAEAWSPRPLPRTEEQDSHYSNPDDDPRGVWRADGMSARNFYSKGTYPITTPSGRKIEGPPSGRYWVYSEQKFRELDADKRIWWGADGNNQPAVKRFLAEVGGGRVPQTLWTYDEVGHTQEAKKELLATVSFPNSDVVFDTPKPTRLMRRILQIATSPEEADLVVDFFAGTGTTMDAVFAQNAEDGGKRRCILVQLPEPLAGAESAGWTSIADITRARVRSAGERHKTGDPSFGGDVGFRSFRLDTSNIRAWAPRKDDVAQSLLDHLDHVNAGRSNDDVLYELLLKLGLDLCVPMQERKIAGKTVHSIGSGVLLTCFDERIGVADAEPLALGIVAWHKEQATAGEVTCVFLDSAFENDVAKTNLAAILEQHGIAKVRSL